MVHQFLRIRTICILLCAALMQSSTPSVAQPWHDEVIKEIVEIYPRKGFPASAFMMNLMWAPQYCASIYPEGASEILEAARALLDDHQDTLRKIEALGVREKLFAHLDRRGQDPKFRTEFQVLCSKLAAPLRMGKQDPNHHLAIFLAELRGLMNEP